jgi:hypothetical protein
VIRPIAIAAALLAGGGASAMERLGVIAVADPPYGPDADLGELAHQLRAACRDRAGGIEEVSTMRARLLGQSSNATTSELDRAYGGALAVYQNGEFESSVRTLRAIVEDLEALPEDDDAYHQWKRALLRLAYTELTVENPREVEKALMTLARTDPNHPVDPEQYPPSFRRRFEEAKSRTRALPKRRLQVLAEGKPGIVYVNGRPMGTTPVVLSLPAGPYRIGGAAGALRVPSFRLDLEHEDRSVVLDFALAEALRVNAGPGLALPAAQRPYGIIRAGAWLGVDRIVVASRAEEGQAQFLLGSIYDVRRGALLREGSVRMVAGSVPSVQLGALAAFLLTGQSSRDVKDRTQEAPREIVPPLPVAALEAAPSSPEPPLPVARLVVPPAAAGAVPALQAAIRPASAPTPAPAPLAPAPLVTASVSPSAPPAAKGAAAPRPPSIAAPKEPRARETAPPAATPPSPQVVAAVPLAAATLAAKPSLTVALPPPDAAPSRTIPVRASPSESARHGARGWTRPTAIGAGALALGLTGFAVYQGMAASSAYADARALVTDGGFASFPDAERYRALRDDGAAAQRNAYVSAGAAVAFAAAAGVFGWMSFDRPPEPALAFRF